MSIPASDADEWRAARSGDGEAFARAFDRHQSRVFRHSLALVPSIDDAQDVVGITFLEAWRKRASVRFVKGSLLPWLLVTATHSSRNVSRSARRYRALLERVPRSEGIPGPDELLDEGPAVAALRDFAPHHRDVITLCVIEGLSEVEAGEVLGVPPGTVKSRLHRAKKALAARVRAPSFPRNTSATSATSPTSPTGTSGR